MSQKKQSNNQQQNSPKEARSLGGSGGGTRRQGQSAEQVWRRLERGAEEDRLEASGKGRNQDQGLDTRHQSSRSGCLQDQLSNRTPNQLPTGNQRLMLDGLSAQNLEWRLPGPTAQVSFLGL